MVFSPPRRPEYNCSLYLLFHFNWSKVQLVVDLNKTKYAVDHLCVVLNTFTTTVFNNMLIFVEPLPCLRIREVPSVHISAIYLPPHLAHPLDVSHGLFLPASHLLLGALMLRPPTNRPRNIPAHTICPPNILSTVTLRPFNILLLWQMDPVTFYYCDTSPPIWHIQVTNVHPP